MPRVLVAPAPLAEVQGEYLTALKDAGFEVVFPRKRAQLNEEELLEHLHGVDASLAGSEPYTRRVLTAHPQLRVIARVGVGYDAVDCQAATEQSVAVCITPGANQDAVAEHAFMLILALAKNLIAQHTGTIAGRWPRAANLPLRGKVLGVAGLGRIGKAVALLGQAFRMNVLAAEPAPDRDFCRQHNVELVPWERLLAESDYLSLHIPLTSASRHTINRKTLALMKPTAFLVNTARGGLVNEADLLEALTGKGLAGAGLDVFEQEPPANDHPFFKLSNVVFTAHTAGVDTQSRDDMALSAAKAIIALFQGDWPAEKIVNPEVRSTFRWR